MMGLCAENVDADAAYQWGLVTHIIDGEKQQMIINDLIAYRWSQHQWRDIDGYLSGLSKPKLPESVWISRQNEMEACFSKSSVEAIVRACQKGSAWARVCAEKMAKLNPISLKVFFRLYHEAKKITLIDELKKEFSVAQHFLSDENFYSGIDAAVISKSHQPQWQPPLLSMLNDHDIEVYFSPSPRVLNVSD